MKFESRGEEKNDPFGWKNASVNLINQWTINPGV